ncbi:MAG: tRNA epoxyqueuosine(34) reductase QueG, partial [Nitrospirales bacterium]
MTLTDTIKQEATRLGFVAVGVSRVEAGPDSSLTPDTPPGSLRARLEDWLRRGYHGTMSWMARDAARRADPAQVLPGCRSLLSVGMNYWTDHRADERPGQGRIARYAWGRDYHDVLGERLAALAARIEAVAPGAHTKWYVDTGPVMEKAWAQRAGLGWIGKHSHLVSTQFGSWLLLGEILTTLALQPDDPGADLCGSCTLCIRACPTGAITEPYVVDASRCISYLTIEFRGREEEIPEDFRRRMGNRIFGCDDCLDVCPYNLQAQPTAEPAFQPTSTTLIPNLSTLD